MVSVTTSISALGPADADPELPVHPGPDRVPEPLPCLLIGPKREAEFLLGVHEELLVDHRWQDRPRQQVTDVVLAAGQDPFLRNVLAGLLHAFPGRPEPGRGQVSGVEMYPGVLLRVRAERGLVAEQLRGGRD